MAGTVPEGIATAVIGVILVVRQRAFVTPHGTEEQLRKRRSDFRKIGIFAIVAGLLLILSGVMSP